MASERLSLMLLVWSGFGGDFCIGHPVTEEEFEHHFRITLVGASAFDTNYSTEDPRVDMGYESCHLVVGSLDRAKEICEEHWRTVKMHLLDREREELTGQIAILEAKRAAIQDQIDEF